jgi:hypothetical protein
MTKPNVFVLCTGRCGSTTFIKAAQQIANFSAGHETRTHKIGPDRFAYPVTHIEADNRLSWLMGRLDAHYGNAAYYVHLQRDLLATARSFLKRHDRGIRHAYRTDILMGASKNIKHDTDLLPLCVDYCHTVNANIGAFLSNKSHCFSFHLDNAESDWVRFWEWIGVDGNLSFSLREWSVKHNASVYM